ncbi:uncharacterized protein BDW47DRAFT_103636 [Aspergillus candidus]|uniref:Uncharacterized protein n=1 Tax=Aspergillus candidus TaxID=41067 RepID=A0A2I2FEL5_ASPCN|nr:hypothetical protein BDW47DRAFT_103636 [Aspergillus candidus]PLB39076.1 hypothetical protein BDW47DRAFT_103636 [Aspergillus candidus]
MSLKRKASFSTPTSPSTPSVIGGRSMMLDDSPQHLNSRTRKRFRDDRPEDKIVYENTLRWLFTAQQRPEPSPAAEAEEMDIESLPAPETVDPRQQTLLKFFQPAKTSSPQSRSKGTHPQPMTPNRTPRTSALSFQQPSLNVDAMSDSIISDTRTPSLSSQGPSMDMDVDMDSGSDETTRDPNMWAGGLGWM